MAFRAAGCEEFIFGSLSIIIRDAVFFASQYIVPKHLC